jgi:hypothetical protein
MPGIRTAFSHNALSQIRLLVEFLDLDDTVETGHMCGTASRESKRKQSDKQGSSHSIFVLLNGLVRDVDNRQRKYP